MKTRLIKTQDKFILVSDEDIKYDDYFFDNNIGLTGQYFQGYMDFTFCNKIIAGIPSLPSIDFSLLSEEDGKEIGWVDVEGLALNDNDFYTYGGDYDTFEVGYKAGFKQTQSLNDKQFNTEDVKRFVRWGIHQAYLDNIYDLDHLEKATVKICNQLLKSLQKTEWDVEVNELNQITKIL